MRPASWVVPAYVLCVGRWSRTVSRDNDVTRFLAGPCLFGLFRHVDV